jgi:hypothetical protein
LKAGVKGTNNYGKLNPTNLCLATHRRV